MANAKPDSKPGVPEILLSLATVPMLAGLIAARAIANAMSAAGEASEEVFRGDRLPILHTPERDSQL